MNGIAIIRPITLLIISGLLLFVTDNASAKPWRLNTALAAPAWLKLGGTFRARIENLDERYRAGRSGSDQVLVVRTTLASEIVFGAIAVGGELLDSRAFYNDSGSTVSTGIINSAELLQAYVTWNADGLMTQDSKSTVKIGRLTMDVGSRRFVARNRYRNTINGFTGIDWQWKQDNGREFRVFYVLPVRRLPRDRQSLLDNDAEFDDESFDVDFWGIYYRFPTFVNANNFEIFLFALNEDDDEDRATRNRELYTPGFRLFKKPGLNQFDYQLETAIQFGESRFSTAVSNTTDLDHFAHFHHAELGYTFDRPWHPRILLQYDYASGDDSPGDRDNERFDTLFGARRFDFGPTSIYGAFARANLSTPGIRIQAKPSSLMSAFVSYRGFWLASDKDAWTTARVRDPSGNSDSFIGHQIEVRVRYNPAPKNLRLEMGVAHLFTEDFVEQAPNAPTTADPTYFYSQLALTF